MFIGASAIIKFKLEDYEHCYSAQRETLIILAEADILILSGET
jgi:hypothetical protein